MLPVLLLLSGKITSRAQTTLSAGQVVILEFNGSSDQGSVTDCYATGTLNGTNQIAGLIGSNYANIIVITCNDGREFCSKSINDNLSAVRI